MPQCTQCIPTSTKRRAGSVAQDIEHLPTKLKALISISSSKKKKKEKEKKTKSKSERKGGKKEEKKVSSPLDLSQNSEND
jgi:hypothetical protein